MFSRPGLIVPQRQQGVALLILVIAIVLAVVAYFVSGLSVNDVRFEQEKKTRASLKKAKDALIAYAVNYPKDHASRGPGYFPCPDDDNDGLREPGCNGPVTIGRFPWKTLNVGDLRDGSNERLWYAVSENYDFTNSPAPPPPDPKVINTSTTGNITVRDRNNVIVNDGTAMDAAVAVIIAPGVAITRDDGVAQDRSIATGDPNAPINYLDIDTASGEDNADFQHNSLDGFINGEIVDAADNVIVNDVIEVITYEDIMRLVHARVYSEIRDVLVAYRAACGAYPDASDFDPTKADDAFDSGTLPAYKGHIPVDPDPPLVKADVTPVNWNEGCAAGINLPDWFFREDWHRETYYEFSTNDPCGVGADCLVINNTDPLIDDAEAIIVFSGRDINGLRHVNALNQYLEGENANGDVIYDAAETDDYVGVIAR